MLHHGSSPLGAQAVQTHAEFLQFLSYAVALGLATHHEAPTAAARYKVRETKETEGLGSRQSLSFALRCRLVAKTQ
ncbi:MAG: hypothetical protein ABI145_17845 [Steroidobacteraceae bacterium]